MTTSEGLNVPNTGLEMWVDLRIKATKVVQVSFTNVVSVLFLLFISTLTLNDIE